MDSADRLPWASRTNSRWSPDDEGTSIEVTVPSAVVILGPAAAGQFLQLASPVLRILTDDVPPATAVLAGRALFGGERRPDGTMSRNASRSPGPAECRTRARWITQARHPRGSRRGAVVAQAELSVQAVTPGPHRGPQ
nr:hypothetical protein [Actinoplanes hulinensis]